MLNSVSVVLLIALAQTPPVSTPPTTTNVEEEAETPGEEDEEEEKDDSGDDEASDAPKPKSGTAKGLEGPPATGAVPENVVPAALPDAAKKEEPKKETEELPPGPRASDFFASDFVDSRVTFAFSNINIFAGAGERLTPTSGYRIGVDRGFNLFSENVNTRFSGYETLSHLVLFKKFPGFWQNWETETALAVLLLADTDTGRVNFFDSGTYLRVIRKFSNEREDKAGSIDLTAWPVSADRFRLGYTFIISWGGTAIFPGKLQTASITEGAVPGMRVRWRAPGGKSYAFAGFKTALLLSRDAGVRAGEQVPNYGLLAGGGTEVGGRLILETNGGFFQKGTQERTEVEGNAIRAFGISGRVTLFDGTPPRNNSNDFRLYRNDPNDQTNYLLYSKYQPGSGYSVAVEGSLLSQNLEDPDRTGSERLVPAVSAGLVAQAKLNELNLRLDAFFQSIDFILFNVPGFVPFQAIPDGATTTPEFFLAATGEYTLDEWKLRPSLSVGVKVPATYRGRAPTELGPLPGIVDGEVQTQVIVDETTRAILPPGKGVVPIIGIVAKVPFAISELMTLSAETRFEINDNQVRLGQENIGGQTTFQFDQPLRLGLALVLQSRW